MTGPVELRDILAINRFSADYHQKSSGEAPSS
jgi:hypothetical protein